MGAVFPSIAQIIATTTFSVDPSSSTLLVAGSIPTLAGYLALPLIALAFVVTVVIMGIRYFRKWLLRGVRKSTKR